jgi:hypothetical protein
MDKIKKRIESLVHWFNGSMTQSAFILSILLILSKVLFENGLTCNHVRG